MANLALDRNVKQRIASSQWVVVAGLYQARLLRYHSPLTKSCQFEECDRIEAPIPTGAFNRFATEPRSAGKPYQARYQQLQAEYRRFARQLSHWLIAVVCDEALERITVFAPAQIIQGLQHRSAELCPAGVDLRIANLMNTYDDGLRRHPAILALFKPPQVGRFAYHAQGLTPATAAQHHSAIA